MDADPSESQCLISPHCHNHPHSRRISLRRGLGFLREPNNFRAGGKPLVCRSRQSFRRRDVCPCKSTLSVRRFEQRSLLGRTRPRHATNPPEWHVRRDALEQSLTANHQSPSGLRLQSEQWAGFIKAELNLEIAQAVSQRRLSLSPVFQAGRKCVKASDDVIEDDVTTSADNRK